VLHRDLKSENLLLSEPGRAGDIRVMDFGLTKLCSALLRFLILQCTVYEIDSANLEYLMFPCSVEFCILLFV
jgi:serine/threonine protein kinase